MMVRILVINPNSDLSMEQVIAAGATEYACADTEVVCRSVPSAPEFIENYLDELLCGPGMVELVRQEEANYDAFIIACHSDVNIDVIREITAKLVIGIGEASMKLASMLGYKFSVIQTTTHSVPMKAELVKKYGLSEQCASIRSVDEGLPGTLVEKISSAAQRAVDQDEAEVIVLGCAGFAGLDKAVQSKVGVPVLSGVTCAVLVAEGLVRYGITTSKRCKYRPQA